ncbi:hypothetical protein [Bartonella gliris]|nr:hypothetical protein [Bartonella gliris]
MLLRGSICGGMRVGRGVLGGLGVVFWFGCFFGGAVAGILE